MTISVIVGSTRQNRFSEKPAQWILQEFRKREGIEARILDLRDFPMPFFDQPVPPAMPGRAPDGRPGTARGIRVQTDSAVDRTATVARATKMPSQTTRPMARPAGTAAPAITSLPIFTAS